MIKVGEHLDLREFNYFYFASKSSGRKFESIYVIIYVEFISLLICLWLF
jgi:hypothetical protein